MGIIDKLVLVSDGVGGHTREPSSALTDCLGARLPGLLTGYLLCYVRNRDVDDAVDCKSRVPNDIPLWIIIFATPEPYDRYVLRNSHRLFPAYVTFQRPAEVTPAASRISSWAHRIPSSTAESLSLQLLLPFSYLNSSARPPTLPPRVHIYPLNIPRICGARSSAQITATVLFLRVATRGITV